MSSLIFIYVYSTLKNPAAYGLAVKMESVWLQINRLRSFRTPQSTQPVSVSIMLRNPWLIMMHHEAKVSASTSQWIVALTPFLLICLSCKIFLRVECPGSAWTQSACRRPLVGFTGSRALKTAVAASMAAQGRVVGPKPVPVLFSSASTIWTTFWGARLTPLYKHRNRVGPKKNRPRGLLLDDEFGGLKSSRFMLGLIVVGASFRQAWGYRGIDLWGVRRGEVWLLPSTQTRSAKSAYLRLQSVLQASQFGN